MLNQALLGLQWETPASSALDAISHLSSCQRRPTARRSKPTHLAVAPRCQKGCREMQGHTAHHRKLIIPKPEETLCESRRLQGNNPLPELSQRVPAREELSPLLPGVGSARSDRQLCCGPGMHIPGKQGTPAWRQGEATSEVIREEMLLRDTK